MKRIAFGATIIVTLGVLILACGPFPPSYAQGVLVSIKYDNIDSVEGDEIKVQRVSTRWNEGSNTPPLSVSDEMILTPERNVYFFYIGMSDGFDKNYIDVVDIRRDSIHNWFVHFEEEDRDKRPKLGYMYYHFNGVRYTKPDTITIDLASK
jgi:hypothetical protein